MPPQSGSPHASLLRKQRALRCGGSAGGRVLLGALRWLLSRAPPIRRCVFRLSSGGQAYILQRMARCGRVHLRAYYIMHNCDIDWLFRTPPFRRLFRCLSPNRRDFCVDHICSATRRPIACISVRLHACSV